LNRIAGFEREVKQIKAICEFKDYQIMKLKKEISELKEHSYKLNLIM